MEVRPRFVATALLVLIALGGAGLAVAADRQQTSATRPEVTWAADNAARPYVTKLTSDLSAIAAQMTTIAKDGRSVLGQLQAIQVQDARTSLADGDRLSQELSDAVGGLRADKADADKNVERWRLGPATTDTLTAIDAAVTSAGQVSGQWNGLSDRAVLVASLVEDLQRHDGLVFRATTAGRQGSWNDALNTLGDAGKSLSDARSARDLLDSHGVAVDTLDQLIARYAAYDSALSGLYEYLGSGGQQSGSDFDKLSRAVDAAQADLPGDSGVFSIIVGDAAGPAITDALVELEQARGDVNAALDAAAGDSP